MSARDDINRRALATDHLIGDITHRTRRGGAIAIGAQLMRLAIQLAALMALARLLAPGDFGLIAMATAITGFVVMFTELGLSAATVQREDIDQDTVSALFLINLAMGLIVMLAVMALAPVAAWFFDDARVRIIVMALAIPIPLLAASRQHAALLQRGMRWIAIESATIAAQALGALAAVAVALTTNYGYWALVVQAWVVASTTLVLIWVACPWRPSRVRDWRGVPYALRFGLHLTGFQFLNYFHRQFDDVLVGWRWGAVELGYYSRAYQLLLMPLQIVTGPVGSVLVPALSRIKDDIEAWRRLYIVTLRLMVLATAMIAGLLGLLSATIVDLAFGPGWQPASRIFEVLTISILAQPIMSSTGWLWVSTGQSRQMLHWAAMSIPLMVIGMLIGLPFGAVGIAAGYAIMICLLTPLCTLFAGRSLPIGIGDVYRPLAAPLIAALVAYALTRGVFAFADTSLLCAAARGATFVAAYLAIVAAIDIALLKQAFGIVRRLVKKDPLAP